MKRPERGTGTSCPAAFDQFLHAGLGSDTNGMELTVLSALARQDVDPWEEAASLSRLPRKLALGKLVAMLEVLPGQRSLAERTALAGRLIPLLAGARSIGGGAAGAGHRWLSWERAAQPNDVSVMVVLVVLTILGGWWFTAASTTAADAPVAPAVPAAVPRAEPRSLPRQTPGAPDEFPQ